ncbi:hypothetical protein C8J98_103375 [Luteibacter sp. OK325]|uniref:hypothetical protein n=1 Tax=Luteibacter sp. OK325 TaxID=2135670 RepID=UPI000D3B36C4|nr:hypothetical protein [Luteibacter sp. OK325]PTR33612.1 hypothetical protein C8J98_103375 [Luteibacter sp. OK325]
MKLGTHALAAMAMVSLGSCSSAYAADKCLVAKAHYTLSSDKRISISFVPAGKHDEWGSDVALRIDTKGGPSYWFMFDSGSARYINMISTTDVKAPHWTPPTGDSGVRPLGEMHYFAWSGKYDFNEAYPQTTARAPERIFLPDLAETMWYRANPRVGLKHGVFVLDSCQ